MNRTPLASLHEARGAQWMEHQGWEIPAYYSSVQEEYEALQEGVALVDFSFRGKLRVTGRDRRTWLHGQVTQDVNGLPDGHGAYAAVLSPKGRMVSDLRLFALPDALLADFPAEPAEPLIPYLDRYLIMERAEIEDLTASHALLSLQGPQACCAVISVVGDEVAELRPWEMKEITYRDEPLYVNRVSHCGEDAFDLWVPAHGAPSLWAALSTRRPDYAVFSVGWEAINIRRTEAGLPWWGAELDGSTVPPEARLEHAVSYEKGCYVGQEIIARIHARGHVNNLLAGFHVEGALPERGAEIRAEGKPVGRVTTALHSLRLDRPIALGYLRREHQETGTRLTVDTPQGPSTLVVTSLPFVPHDYPTP
ncbi:MAG: YgfZ/GcvT domain-containing protein [Armatimonadota bacterium]